MNCYKCNYKNELTNKFCFNCGANLLTSSDENIPNKLLNKHLILSTILLLPASIYLENRDGLEMVDDVYGAVSEWIAAFLVSLVIAVFSWGIFYIIKKKSSFVKALYKSCYLISFISVFTYWIFYGIRMIF
jgi:hypothetical protein